MSYLQIIIQWRMAQGTLDIQNVLTFLSRVLTMCKIKTH
jgi:hypothetical protein